MGRKSKKEVEAVNTATVGKEDRSGNVDAVLFMRNLNYWKQEVVGDTLVFYPVRISHRYDGPLGIDFPFDSVFSRVSIDIKNNIIKGWILPSSTSHSRIEARKLKENSVAEKLNEKEIILEKEKGNVFEDPADRVKKGYLNFSNYMIEDNKNE